MTTATKGLNDTRNRASAKLHKNTTENSDCLEYKI